jgi:quinol monooxygenase YgiN
MDKQTFTPTDTVSAIIGKFRDDLGAHAGTFGLLVRFQVHQGVAAQVVKHFSVARAPSLHDPGCITFEMSQHATDSRQFAVYEKWASLSNLEMHLRTRHAAALRDAFNKLLDGLPEFTILIPADGR